jgi:hypothetical protein
MANAIRNLLPVAGNSAWCRSSKAARITAAKVSARRSEILNERDSGSSFLRGVLAA